MIRLIRLILFRFTESTVNQIEILIFVWLVYSTIYFKFSWFVALEFDFGYLPLENYMQLMKWRTTLLILELLS